MTGHYLKELNNLTTVYNAAMSADISELSVFLQSISQMPLTAVGSGGSLSTAAFAASMHEHFFSEIARASTPLETLSNVHTRGATLCFSASGRNRDIGVAFKRLCLAESGPIGALVMAEDTPLHAIKRQHDLAKIFSVSHSSFKDGFLAVATMVASAVLITRSYEAISGNNSNLPDSIEKLARLTIGQDNFAGIIEEVATLVNVETISLIYSPSTKPAAIDLESRFVEAALGNLHIADLRNFGHGRHHWLAKRANRTGVIALVGSDWGNLASRTLSHLPDGIPIYRIDLNGPFVYQALSALILGLFISHAAGKCAGIDPGKPGVPEFGRRLYRLGPGPLRRKQSVANREAAIKRKLPKFKKINLQSREWNNNYDVIVKRLAQTNFGGVVLDFDGTLCDVNKRFDPLSADVATSLNSLLDSGLMLGIATGRGPSAGNRLREVIHEKFWGEIIIGYYNAGFITSLSNKLDPILANTCSDDLSAAVSRNEQFQLRRIRSNPAQITLHLDQDENADYASSVITSIAQKLGETVQIVTSGHSIDILRKGQCKSHVVSRLAQKIGISGNEILRIGDQGNWPGNDAVFLDSPYGLSVDQASHHKQNCWNLAPAGISGVQAALYYMASLKGDKGTARLILKANDRGQPREA